MKVYGYARVSTARQSREGLSLDVQQQAIKSYAELYSTGLDEILVEAGASASTLAGRPVFCDLLKRCETGGVRAVVVVKVDRAFRNLRDAVEVLAMFSKRGIDFHSVQEHLDTSTASGRFFLNMLLSLAELERDKIGERVSEVLRVKKAVGPGETGGAMRHRHQTGKLAVGGAPYGYQWEDGKLVPEQREMAIACEILKQAAMGRKSPKIASDLRLSGSLTRHGKVWNDRQVRRIIKLKGMYADG